MNLIFGVGILVVSLFSSCGPSASDPCDCFNNALKKGQKDFNQALDKECEEYESKLSYQEKLDRLGEIDRRGCVKY